MCFLAVIGCLRPTTNFETPRKDPKLVFQFVKDKISSVNGDKYVNFTILSPWELKHNFRLKLYISCFFNIESKLAQICILWGVFSPFADRLHLFSSSAELIILSRSCLFYIMSYIQSVQKVPNRDDFKFVTHNPCCLRGDSSYLTKPIKGPFYFFRPCKKSSWTCTFHPHHKWRLKVNWKYTNSSTTQCQLIKNSQNITMSNSTNIIW